MTPLRNYLAAESTSQSVESGRAVVTCCANDPANAYAAERLWGCAQRRLRPLLRDLQARLGIRGTTSRCGCARLHGSTCRTRGSTATVSPFPCLRGVLRISGATACPAPSPRTTEFEGELLRLGAAAISWTVTARGGAGHAIQLGQPARGVADWVQAPSEIPMRR